MDTKNLRYVMSFNIIAYLKLKGFEIRDKEITEDDKVKYWFDDKPELLETIKDFKNNEELLKFIDIQKQLRKEMYELKQDK